jgi:hypothetical protein
MVGGSLRDVQALAGHASLSATSRCIEINSEAQQKIVDILYRGDGVMMGQKIAEPLKGKVKPAKHHRQAATPMIDKIIGRCKANIRAIDLLDEDQKEYLRTNAKAFLAARMKKMKMRQHLRVGEKKIISE